MELFLLVALVLAIANAVWSYPTNFLFAVTGDDDMKIAPVKGFASETKTEDAAEISAQQFLEMKRSGLIQKAHVLGEKYAELLLQESEKLIKNQQEVSLLMHQQIVLYSYTVNRVTCDCAPNSILAQTILNVFFNKLEEKSVEINNHVSDMAAFSLYLLCNRRGCTDNDIGQIYAQLCGDKEDEKRINEGIALFQSLYNVFLEEYNTAFN